MTDQRVLVAGGAGFVGAHLCRRLVQETEVICVDSLITGRTKNVADLEKNSNFRMIRADICDPLDIGAPLDAIYHLASPASPTDYMRHPLTTLRTSSIGTMNLLELAERTGAVFVLTSTSEVYGDPEIHPQKETYWGKVNPIGPRSPYDEGKRFSESAAMTYHRNHDVPIRIGRLFNTYGPGMRSGDGRVVPTFITQALAGTPLTVFGDGRQTRSLCFVDDTVDGIYRLRHAEDPGPYNLGNPDERTILEIAELIIQLTGSKSAIENRPLPQDDPTRRCPDITRATEGLGWKPTISLQEGMKRTIEDFRKTS